MKEIKVVLSDKNGILFMALISEFVCCKRFTKVMTNVEAGCGKNIIFEVFFLVYSWFLSQIPLDENVCIHMVSSFVYALFRLSTLSRRTINPIFVQRKHPTMQITPSDANNYNNNFESKQRNRTFYSIKINKNKSIYCI